MRSTMLAAAGLLCASSVASADTLDFSCFAITGDDTVSFDISVHDDVTAGRLTFDIAVDSSPIVADIVALYIDFVDGFDASLIEMTTPTLFDTDSVITDLAYNTRNVQAGNIGRRYDLGLAIGETGLRGGTDDIQSFRFEIATSLGGMSLGLADLTEFAVRGTSVGTLGGSREESTKQFYEPDTRSVPLPTTAAAGLAGLMGLSLRRRRA